MPTDKRPEGQHFSLTDAFIETFAKDVQSACEARIELRYKTFHYILGYEHTLWPAPSARSQAKLAAQDVARAWATRIGNQAVASMPNDKLLHEVTPVDITDADLRKATSAWYVQGLSPSTINKRLNGLGTMGVDIGKGVRPKTRKSLQWWLRPEARDTMHGMVTLSDEFKDYVMWTTHCGFRVEENLRLRREHFSDDFTEVTVPGTKTATAQASLYLPPVCQRIARKRFEMADMMVKPYGGKGGRMDQPLFGMDYRALREEWDHFRDVLGQHDNPGCTLKALRRTAARYLHIDCKMPLDYVRQYLRHEDVETTIGYLRLTGGLTTKEMKGYLE